MLFVRSFANQQHQNNLVTKEKSDDYFSNMYDDYVYIPVLEYS